MPQPQDDLTQLETNFPILTQAFTDISTGIAALDAQIVAFQNSPGTLSAADQGRLDTLVSSSASLAAAAKALAVAANKAPTAPVTPIPAPVVPPPAP